MLLAALGPRVHSAVVVHGASDLRMERDHQRVDD